jgi:hypothetical protein
MNEYQIDITNMVFGILTFFIGVLTFIVAGFIAYSADKIAKNANRIAVYQNRAIIYGHLHVASKSITFSLDNIGGSVSVIASFVEIDGGAITRLVGKHLWHVLRDDVDLQNALGDSGLAGRQGHLQTLGQLSGLNTEPARTQIFGITPQTLGRAAAISFTQAQKDDVKAFFADVKMFVLIEEINKAGDFVRLVFDVPLSGAPAKRIFLDTPAWEDDFNVENRS